MSPPPLTPEQRIESEKKRKEYMKQYKKSIPIELKRIYRKTTTAEKQHEYYIRHKNKHKEKQILKN